jgi:hypothetical protein
MDSQEMLEELEALAEKLAIKVRYEKCRSRGGLCRVNNEPMIIVRKTLTVPERMEILAGALCDFPLDDTYLKPELRSYLEEVAASREESGMKGEQVPSDSRESVADGE